MPSLPAQADAAHACAEHLSKCVGIEQMKRTSSQKPARQQLGERERARQIRAVGRTCTGRQVYLVKYLLAQGAARKLRAAERAIALLLHPLVDPGGLVLAAAAALDCWTCPVQTRPATAWKLCTEVT
jgi:hypothetical protein